MPSFCCLCCVCYHKSQQPSSFAFLFKCQCVCLCLCTGTETMACMWGRRTAWRSCFSSPTMLVPGTELRSSSLATVSLPTESSRWPQPSSLLTGVTYTAFSWSSWLLLPHSWDLGVYSSRTFDFISLCFSTLVIPFETARDSLDWLLRHPHAR